MLPTPAETFRKRLKRLSRKGDRTTAVSAALLEQQIDFWSRLPEDELWEAVRKVAGPQLNERLDRWAIAKAGEFLGSRDGAAVRFVLVLLAAGATTDVLLEAAGKPAAFERLLANCWPVPVSLLN